MIIGYEMYRNLSSHKFIKNNKKLKEKFTKFLVDPGLLRYFQKSMLIGHLFSGPDLVICDEGHLLKNCRSGISIAMNQVRTRRRVVLTGTPLQNNLIECNTRKASKYMIIYCILLIVDHCMVDFVKPSLLGNMVEFRNRFVNPITNGQVNIKI